MGKCIVEKIAKGNRELLGDCVDCDKVLVCADLLNKVCEYMIGIAKDRKKLSKSLKKGGG